MIKIIFSTFILVFLAELGDKTQLTTMLLASQSSSRTAVFIGSSIALLLSSLCGVLLGSILNKYIPQNLIQYAAGFSFILIGALLIFNKL